MQRKCVNIKRYLRYKESILAKQKEYRENNKELIAERKKQPKVIAYKKTPIYYIL